MNNTPNNINIGRCAVCAGEAVLTTHDQSTGMSVGRCCAQVLDDATRMIKLTMANIQTGLRHPLPGEFTSEQNH